MEVLSWLSVGMRLHIRIFRYHCPGWDDAIIFFALVSIFVANGLDNRSVYGTR